MPRFFLESPPQGNVVPLAEEDARHITRVLRMQVGEALTLCDGCGNDYSARLASTDPVTAKILSTSPSVGELPANITLYQSLPKSDKMEWIIQKSVELGVTRVVPVLSNRCVSRPNAAAAEKKKVRYQKIAREAAMQCRRGRIPTVESQITFAEALEDSKDTLRLFCYEGGGEPLSAQMLRGEGEISLFIGCEGGFAPEEAEAAKEQGCTFITLGNRILRCETAPLCALSILQYLLSL